ncbi:MAG: KDGP aldolase [Candidatus Pristimantibacillus lignocellulolyticus]|uniref:KDGP aldolase n=1 Tax=Candidatus Pristimantibacillus lignocellulolyticus TaxID=2994561 RepID=A0A9J6ZD07_9BACL|nr:MAG: KDGP aldolase [Candidatus Pristimantibacillus lignocellulolyticus]
MSNMDKRLYKGKVALNVLTNSIQNAKDIFAAAEGHVLVGILSKAYPDVLSAVAAMKEYGLVIDNAVSIGLGAGDSRQGAVVAEIVKHYAGAHINQIFPAVGATSANLNSRNSWINSLVSPCGKPGFVNISTGVFSGQQEEKAIVPVKAAIALVRDMGGHALKYFPMGGLKSIDEYRLVAKACGEEDFALEPTGGIDLDNFSQILDIALSEGVPQVIPHVYTSIIDSVTGATKIEDVQLLLELVKEVVGRYE